MNKLFFGYTPGWRGPVSSYCFFASWDENEVEYEIEDGCFHEFEYGFYPGNPKKIKGKLNADLSKRFIDYIEKADFYGENEKEELEPPLIICDGPEYNLVYIEDNFVSMKCSDNKYVYLALMLCDGNVFDFLLNVTDEQSGLVPFSGKLRSFYYSYDKTIQDINGCQNQTKYGRVDDNFKEELVKLFSEGNSFVLNEESIRDWQIVLVNDEDEIFYYYGDVGQYKELDELNKFVNGYIYEIEENSVEDLSTYKLKIRGFLIDRLKKTPQDADKLIEEYKTDIEYAFNEHWSIESIAYPMIMGL